MDAVEEIKGRLAIEDVVSEYVQLKRAGRNFRGLSPWTSEKTPSFMVSPEKQIWHDFSSGKGGNMFSFVMEMEGLDFKGALELLARKAGVDIEQYRGHARRGPDKERLYAALEAAAHFYQVQFSKNKTALEYVFKNRQFTKETALAWRLGYSPAPPAGSGSTLTSYLRTKKFTSEEIKRAGLSNSYGKDMFRGRLMIPLMDGQGRVVGFTARILAAGEPKYINTPSTVLYDKSRHVFGLHLAKEAIRKSGYAVLVEGNLDVIASWQAGVRQVVATAGTALTEQHLKALGRFTGDIRLCFDQDRAGLAAAERAIPLASRAGVNLSIINLPSGKDPDELIREGGSQAWSKAARQPEYALDWLIGRYQKLLDLASAEGKRKFSDVLLPVVRGLQDPVEQDHYLGTIAELSAVSREAIVAKLKQNGTSQNDVRRRSVNVQPVDRHSAEQRKLEERFMALMLAEPALRTSLKPLTPDMLASAGAQRLLSVLKANPELSSPETAPELSSLTENVKIWLLQYEELYQGLEPAELMYEAQRLQARLVSIYVKSKKQQLATSMHTANEEQTQHLLGQANQLDKLLKEVSGGIHGES